MDSALAISVRELRARRFGKLAASLDALIVARAQARRLVVDAEGVGRDRGLTASLEVGAPVQARTPYDGLWSVSLS